MIGRLTGRIARRSPGEVLIDVSGVGYRVSIPLSTLCALPTDGQAATLEVHTVVRDDAILLYGFASSAERDMFEVLLSVSGVGPKVGLAILSGLTVDDVVRAVEAGDSQRLRSIPGVGRKIAERIVLEIRERITKMPQAAASGPGGVLDEAREAESALVHLGYASSEAREALERVRREAPEKPTLERLLREALRILAK